MWREHLATSKQVVRRFAYAAALLVVWLWCLGVLWFAGIAPIGLRYAVIAIYVLAFPVWLLRGGDLRYVVVGFLATAGAIALLWQTRLPRLDREWTREMRQLPRVSFDGDEVTIEGIRRCRYRNVTDYDLNWDTRTLDLRRLRTVDFLVERFADYDGAAHTLLSFGFDDGEHVVLSVEIRREVGEEFAPLAGVFRQFELVYVVGDERDLVQLRTTHRGSRVYLFPIRSEHARIRALFEAMLRRAHRLGERPEFYNTITSTCTSNIVLHLDDLSPGRIPFSRAVLLPGYAGRLVHEIGMVDVPGTWEEVERKCRIDEVARAAGDSPRFSEAIRAHVR